MYLYCKSRAAFSVVKPLNHCLPIDFGMVCAGHDARRPKRVRRVPAAGSCEPPYIAVVLREPLDRPQSLSSVPTQSPNITLLFLLTQPSKLPE